MVALHGSQETLAMPETEFTTAGLPLIAYFDKGKHFEIIGEFEADGCVVLDNHVYTIEGGGMKTIDTAQIDFKKIADPHGLMNPGKTEDWQADMTVPAAISNA